MKRPRFIFIILLTIIFTAQSYSQNDFKYRLSTISVNQGLSQHDVSSIVQDSTGFIWIATYDGLHRYDGANFKIFHYNPSDPNSISDNRILQVFIDSKSRLWVATGGGGLNLYNYDKENFRSFSFNSSNKNDKNVNCIFEDKDHFLWIGTSNGVYKTEFDDVNGSLKIVYFDIKPKYNVFNVRAISEDNDGNIYIGGNSGLIKMIQVKQGNDIKSKRFLYNQILIETGVLEIKKDNAGTIWIGTNDGLFVYDGLSCMATKYKFSNNDNFRISSIVKLGENKIIVGTETSGIFVINYLNNTKYKLNTDNEYYLSRAFIKNLFVDKMQNLWMGSSTSGIATINLNSKKFYREYISEIDGSNFIRFFLKDSQGREWIQSKQDGLILNNKDEKIELKFQNKKTPPLAIAEDKNKNIWITSNNSILFYKNNGNIQQPTEITETSFFPKDLIKNLRTPSTIEEDYYGNIWIGTWNGLFQIKQPNENNRTFRFYNNFEVEKDNLSFITLYAEKDTQRLWACSRNFGLFLFDLDRNGDIIKKSRFFFSGNARNEINSNHVWSVIKSSTGKVWVCTDVGLNSIEIDNGDTIIKKYEDVERVKSEKILGITEDDNHDLWINTSVGLLCFNPKNSQLRQFYYTDGLSSSALTEGTQKYNDGKIYLSSINGITYFNPSEININDFVPKIAFTNLKIFNKTIEVGDKINGHLILNKTISETKSITLKHSENNFSLEFIALNFKDPSRNKYAHKLEGYDQDWIVDDGRNRNASYNNLDPGKYILKVKTAAEDGSWNEQNAQIEINVKTAPWFSWWAYLLYTFLVLSIVYVIFRYYRNQQQLKVRLNIEKIERKHDKELNETKLKFHTNITHEIRTPLTLILSPLEDLINKNNDDEFSNSRLNLIKKNTDKLLNLVNQFLDLRKIDKESLPLKVHEIDIIELISDLVENYKLLAKQKKVSLNLIPESEQLLGWIDLDKASKIFNNLISNALKFTPAGGTINIYLSQLETDFVFSIEDTGCGIKASDLNKIFERFYQSDNNSANGTGIGLALVSKLVELHHANIKVESELDKGSVFTVTIPFTVESYSDVEINNESNKIFTLKNEVKKPQTNKPILLVIEDDDDMREYLDTCLSNHFDLILENNAQSGHESALKYIPDLIITDWMMPGMTGLELCEILKNDFRTSHIPIIILTAKSNNDDLIKGYQTGAEIYITKPFNSEQLILQIKNIITYRKQILKDGSDSDDLSKQINLNEREQKFIDKLTNIILSNIDLTDFNVEEICKEIGTSRMQLHRKLTALTGQSASEFIRDLRMSKAKELLESRNFNVSEVIYQVGFKSNSHFARAFKETFGFSPSDLIKKK
ncbi:MAG: response regulator [Paludibacter sp.]|nr:response regulator [Paludibacter sp.]